MKIELEDIREDVYANFMESIRSSETKRGYTRNLRKFLNLIPNNIFEEYLGESPRSREIDDLSASFTHLAKKDIKITKSIIKSYIKEIKKEVDFGTLSPNTVSNRIKPIKALLIANEIDISWKLINKTFPREVKSQDRAYTKEEIQRILKHCVDILDKLIILMFSSAGFRLEAWDYFCWKDVIPLQNDDKHHAGAALRIYRGDPEEYWTFITPEACECLMLYKEEWKSRFMRYPNDDDPLIVSARFDIPHRLYQKGVRARVDKIVTKIGLRDELKKGKRRYEVKLDHGFRKYFNTMMRRAKINYLDKEDMMIADKIPTTLISDGGANFHQAWKENYKAKNFLWKDTEHIRHIHMKGDKNNNRMERLNGTIRDREVAYRGIKKMNSPLFDGFQTFYNFSKKHDGIGKKTPAEMAGILVDGSNKWKTIIQNASLNQYQ